MSTSADFPFVRQGGMRWCSPSELRELDKLTGKRNVAASWLANHWFCSARLMRQRSRPIQAINIGSCAGAAQHQGALQDADISRVYLCYWWRCDLSAAWPTICAKSLYLLLIACGRGPIITFWRRIIGVDHHGTTTPGAKQQTGKVGIAVDIADSAAHVVGSTG